MHASIQAGAGTGKTTKVVRLLLERLLGTGTEPGRLLALTFTVRAANAMRDRLGTWLINLVDGAEVRELGGGIDLFGPPERVREYGRRALAEIDRIEIGTIHSFAGHLLRQYPIEAGVSPDFAEDDGTVEAAIFRDLWPRWLAERLGEPGDVERLSMFLDRIDIAELRSFASVLCGDDAPLEFSEDAGVRGMWSARLAAARARVQVLLNTFANKADGRNKRVVETLRLMHRIFSSSRVSAEVRRRARLLDEEWPRSVAWRGSASEYRELRGFARAVVACDDETMGNLVEWLRPLAMRVRGEHIRKGFVSFPGLLVRAAALLRDHPDIRGRLKGRFQLIIVDEFQDTDPLQGEILLLLAEREDRHAVDCRDVQLAPGKLVIVGDEKQSIYLFRGADLDAYQNIRDRLTAGRLDRIERLSINHRARPELVRFVNVIGRHTMLAPEYVPIDAGPVRPSGGRIEMILFPHADAEQARALEGQAIAAWIAAGVRAGEFRAGDVAVLLRSLGAADHYTVALRAAGVEFVIEGEKHFYSTQEVVDALNLLTTIVDPSDEVALTGVLRSPLGAVRDRDLVELRDAGALGLDGGERVPEDLPHVRVLYVILDRLRARCRRVPARDLIRETCECLPLLELARATVRGDQAVANVRKFLDAVSADETRTLMAILDDLRRRFRQGEEEGEAALGDDMNDAVRILSIHKAKGLEFPVVVLADLHREQPRHERPPVLRDWVRDRVGLRCGSICSTAWAAALDRYDRLRREEERRLLYVALTRARDRLLLTGGSVRQGLLRVLLGALGEAGLGTDFETEGRRVLRGEGFEVAVSVGERADVQPREVPEPCVGAEGHYEAERARWRERRRRRDAFIETPILRQPSAPANGQGFAHSQSTDDSDRVVRLERDEEHGTGSSVGARCHDALAAIDLTAPSCEDLDEPVRLILTSFFETEAFREIQRATSVHREVPFLISVDGDLWSGQLDILYRVDGAWIVGDYKSDRKVEPERYRQQARVYSQAARQALRLSDAPAFRLIYLRGGQTVSL